MLNITLEKNHDDLTKNHNILTTSDILKSDITLKKIIYELCIIKIHIPTTLIESYASRFFVVPQSGIPCLNSFHHTNLFILEFHGNSNVFLFVTVL